MDEYRLQTADGVSLAVSHRPPPKPNGAAVLLVHGACSNASGWYRFVPRLLRAGYACWLLELRGHGRSDRGPHPPSMSRFADEDLPAAIERVGRRTGPGGLFLLGHSAGGLACWMALARRQELLAQVAAVITLGSQATGDGRWPRGLAMRLTELALRWAPLFPGRKLGIGPEDESSEVIGTWARWNRQERWVEEGVDYLPLLSQISVPALVVAGRGDYYVAPPEACRRLWAALGSTDKTFLVLGRETGCLGDVGHAELVVGQNSTEVFWPMLEEWMRRRIRQHPTDSFAEPAPRNDPTPVATLELSATTPPQGTPS